MNYKKLIFTFMLAAPLGVASAQKNVSKNQFQFAYCQMQSLEIVEKYFGPAGELREQGRKKLLRLAKGLKMEKIPQENEKVDANFLERLAKKHCSDCDSYDYSSMCETYVYQEHFHRLLIKAWRAQPE